jgi:1,4-alpha-glucan branching enzyme
MIEEKKGHLVLTLHNHLPYVIGHGTWPHGMDWLNEAAAETYVPLLEMLERLRDEGIKAGLTVGITPVLAEQLDSEVFKDDFDKFLEHKIASAAENAEEFRLTHDPEMVKVAEMWRDHFGYIRELFNVRFQRNLLKGFRKLQDDGCIEIITCAATHGYLPLLGNDENVRAQIMTGVRTYKKHFGRAPKGIWLPECAFRPRYRWSRPVETDNNEPVLRAGVEEYLHDAGIKYFYVDTHVLQGGKPMGTYLERFDALRLLWDRAEAEREKEFEPVEVSHLNPYLASSHLGIKPVAFYTRDPETTVQVWSGEHGYPGNGHYLDFHKKHHPGGHRYWRVTSAKSDLADKEPYQPEKIENIVHEQGHHFSQLVTGLLEEHHKKTGKPGMISSQYDGELFGHWWFEGQRWLESVVRAFDQHDTVAITPGGKYLEMFPPEQIINIPEGSWGEGGHHYIWLNKENEWSWKLIYEAEDTFLEIARELGDRQGLAREIIEQMARELLLLESSDWQFLISTVSARDYAEARVEVHYNNVLRLGDIAREAMIGSDIAAGNMEFLRQCQETDKVFEIDLDDWVKPIELKE